MDLARELMMAQLREHPLTLHNSADGLTLFDDWSGIPSHSRDDFWG